MAESEWTIEQFLFACQTWNLPEVNQIIESGFLVDTFDDDHVTGLQMAAATGNAGIVQYLLDQGADIEKSNQVGMTPLHHASKNGHANIVRILVQRGANYHKLTYLGASAITLAAAGGHTEVLKLLLELRVTVNPSHTALCPTPIIAATFRRYTHVCTILAHSGATLDYCMERLSNLSALSTAISCSATTVISSLLELGANPSFRSLHGQNAAELAKTLNDDEAIVVLTTALRHSSKKNESHEVDLRQLIYSMDESKLRLALEQHQKQQEHLHHHNHHHIRLNRIILPSTTNVDNATPTIYAVLLANHSILKMISEFDSDNVNSPETIGGLTPLMLASLIGDFEMIDYLLSIGADASAMSYDGFTAIDYLFATGNLNADLLSEMQLQVENNRQGHQRAGLNERTNFSRMIQSSGTKILNKLTLHVGLSSNSDGTSQRSRVNFGRSHFMSLLRVHTHGHRDFLVANEMLRSFGDENLMKTTNAIDACMPLARYIAENCSNRGFLHIPVIFSLEEVNSKIQSASMLARLLEASTMVNIQINGRQREFLSLAQKNGFSFYEYRFCKSNRKKLITSSQKSQQIRGDSGSHKVGSSTSTSDCSPSMKSRNYSSPERQIAPVLGTTPRFRSRSREKLRLSTEFMSRYDTNDTEDMSDQNSPSRSSLNQYTFALRDGEEHLRKNMSMPTLESLPRISGSLFAHQAKVGSMDTSRIRTKRRQKLTEELIWEKMSDVGLANYADLMQAEEIDKHTFLTLTNEDLLDLGIDDSQTRCIILKLISRLKYL